MTVALLIDDHNGNAARVTAEEGDTVLDALLMEGVPFPYSCQSGNCGTCRCELVSGDILELERSEHALSECDRMRDRKNRYDSKQRKGSTCMAFSRTRAAISWTCSGVREGCER